MRTINLSPREYPPQKGESWWIVHPNNGNVEFKAPIGAVTVCTQDINTFTRGTAYTIAYNDEHGGYISVNSKEETLNMPYYLFARYFDAESFVRPISSGYKHPPLLRVTQNSPRYLFED